MLTKLSPGQLLSVTEVFTVAQIRMLLNECETINRNDQCIYIAGIDDAHFYRADNIEKAGSGIPSNAFSILLSHTPEIYQQAAHADFVCC